MFFLDLMEAVIARLRPSRRESRGRSDSRAVGDAAEEYALELLRKAGFRLIEQSLRDDVGELDFVGKQKGFDGIVVVEVRARKAGGLVEPKDSVNRKKQRQVVKTARRLLPRHGLKGKVRYDIVGVWLDKAGIPTRAERYESAFDASVLK